jgi:hypothetical protein
MDHYCSLGVFQQETQQKKQWTVEIPQPATAAA